MRRESFQGILLGIVIMCAVFAFITIAWATFNSTLSISGTATVGKQAWIVQFTNTKGTQISGNSVTYLTCANGSTQAVCPAANSGFNIDAAHLVAGGTIGQLNVEGDYIEYTWFVENYGTFNADLTLTTDNTIATNTYSTGSNIPITCTAGSSTFDTTNYPAIGEGEGQGAGTANAWCAKHIKAVLYYEADGNTNATTAIPASSSGSQFKTGLMNKDATGTGIKKARELKLRVEFVGIDNTENSNPETSPADVTISIPTISFSATQSSTTQTTSSGS